MALCLEEAGRGKERPHRPRDTVWPRDRLPAGTGQALARGQAGPQEDGTALLPFAGGCGQAPADQAGLGAFPQALRAHPGKF